MGRLSGVAFASVLAACAAAHPPEDAGPPATDAGHDAATIIPCTCDTAVCHLDLSRGAPCLYCCGSPSGMGYCCDFTDCTASGCLCATQPACATPLACCTGGFRPEVAGTCVDVDTYYRAGCDSVHGP